MNLDIWAFVRVMVALEEAAKGTPAASLYALWEEAWQEVDQQLSELADTDFDAYSDMMMNTQIALDLPPAQSEAFGETLKALIADLEAKRASTNDPEFKKDLGFEIEGLKAVLAA